MPVYGYLLSADNVLDLVGWKRSTQSSPCSQEVCNLQLDEVEIGKDDTVVQRYEPRAGGGVTIQPSQCA